jgi:DNA-binding NarL/FixJ family response regulator
MKQTRILIADDHSLVRMGLVSLIGYQKDMEVVGEAESGELAVSQALRLKPDILIMDIMMPGLDGASATKQVLEALPSTRVFILTSFGSSADLLKAVMAGATGAFLKDSPNNQLLDAIRRVARGETIIQDVIKQQLTEAPSLLSLSQRQLEILHSASCGFSTEDIAHQLSMTPDGVKKHFASICSKLGASTRSEAIAIALRRQLLKI